MSAISHCFSTGVKQTVLVEGENDARRFQGSISKGTTMTYINPSPNRKTRLFFTSPTKGRTPPFLFIT